MSSGLMRRLDPVEEAELCRLEGRGEPCETVCDTASPASGTCSSGGATAAAGATETEGVRQEAVVEEAHEQLVTGYAEYRTSLVERKNYRKAEDIDLRLPQASTAMGAAPRMRNYPRTEEGRREWKKAFNKHAGGFAHSHVAAGTVKRRTGQVGLFGDYCEQEGHGEFVRWEKQSRGTLAQIVVPVRNEATGQMKVPEPETIGEYMMVMAVGDTEARPKGGTAEYRNAWHHARQQAHFKLKREAAEARVRRVRGQAASVREHGEG